MHILEIFILKGRKIPKIFLKIFRKILIDFRRNFLFCTNFCILIAWRTFAPRNAQWHKGFAQKSVVQGTFRHIFAKFRLFI